MRNSLDEIFGDGGISSETNPMYVFKKTEGMKTGKSQGAMPVVRSGTFQIVNGICLSKELSK